MFKFTGRSRSLYYLASFPAPLLAFHRGEPGTCAHYVKKNEGGAVVHHSEGSE